MKNNFVTKRYVVSSSHTVMCLPVLLISFIIAIPLYAQAPIAQQYTPAVVTPPPQLQMVSPQGEYLKGKVDGEQEGKSESQAIWFLFGCSSPIWAYVSEPDAPSAAALIGKSSEYIMGYNEGYKKSVKANRIKQSWTGCIVGGTLYCVCYIIYFCIVMSLMSSSSGGN